MRTGSLLVVCGGFLGLAAVGNTQPYSLESSTVDGGGGASGGGPFTLMATIGQPDAGTLTGGQFTLAGGFWPGLTSVTIPGGPTLFIERLGPEIRLSWTPATPGFVIEQAGAVGSDLWSPVPGDTQNPVVLPAGERARYFRLRRP